MPKALVQYADAIQVIVVFKVQVILRISAGGRVNDLFSIGLPDSEAHDQLFPFP